MKESVILYSTHCPQCRILKDKLKGKKIEFSEINDIDTMLAKGFMSAPILEVDGKVMIFSEANNWINMKGNNEWKLK